MHFEAPAAPRLDSEMRAFMDWFNTGSAMDPVLKSALAHLWFVTIHPFDDGSGRVARAIADTALARSEHSSQRFYSMSAQISQERTAYYDILEATQKDGMNMMPWLEWFLACLGRAIAGAQTKLADVMDKAKFWESLTGIPLNDRQRLVLNRLVQDFEGNLTSTNYAKLAKCSHDTGLRDIHQLVEKGILAGTPKGGRSTSYVLANFPKIFKNEPN